MRMSYCRKQIAYYRARAPEYDAAYGQRIEVDSLITQLCALRVEEMYWSWHAARVNGRELLVTRARTVTALDAAPRC